MRICTVQGMLTQRACVAAVCEATFTMHASGERKEVLYFEAVAKSGTVDAGGATLSFCDDHDRVPEAGKPEAYRRLGTSQQFSGSHPTAASPRLGLPGDDTAFLVMTQR